MIINVWGPRYSYYMMPTTIIFNFLLDGIIYLSCIFLYFRLSSDENRKNSAFISDIKGSWLRHLVAIILHVIVGYIVDYLIFFNFEERVITSGYSVTPLSDVFLVWGVYFLFLTICQGLTLCITLRHRFSKWKINLIIGAILFGLITNPMNLTLPYYIDYWM